MSYIKIYNGNNMVKMKLGYITGIVMNEGGDISYENSHPYIKALGTDLKSLYKGFDLKYGNTMTNFATIFHDNYYLGEPTGGNIIYDAQTGWDYSQLEFNGDATMGLELQLSPRKKVYFKSVDNFIRAKDYPNLVTICHTNLMLFATDAFYKDGQRVYIALYENKKTITGGWKIDVEALGLHGKENVGYGWGLNTRKGATTFVQQYLSSDKDVSERWYKAGTRSIVETTFNNGTKLANVVKEDEVSASQWYFVPPFIKGSGTYGNIWNPVGFLTKISANVENPDIPDPDEDPDLEPEPEPPDPPDPDPDNPPESDDDTTDPIPPPVPSPIITFGTKLITIYKLNSDEINAFANEMWTKNFLDNMIRLFANPMDCIISLCEYPFTVPANSPQQIVLGNVKLETTAAIVTNPMVTIDMGSLTLPEYWQNFLDYTNTKLAIFLPFIGFEQISIDYMNCILSLKYNIDIVSGNCVAVLSANSLRNNLNSVVGQWTGNCNYQIPLSGRDYSQMASQLWNTASSVASTLFASRTPINAGNIVNGVSNIGSNVINMVETANNVTSGGKLGANAGFLSIKRPYLMITRPQTKLNSNRKFYEAKQYDGYTPFAALRGKTIISSWNQKVEGATPDEIVEIDRLLKSGVIF